MQIGVTVTDEDIRLGTPKNPNKCPVALALLRETGANSVMVTETTAVAMMDDCVLDGDLPADVEDFVRRFDSGLAVPRIDFELDMVD